MNKWGILGIGFLLLTCCRKERECQTESHKSVYQEGVLTDFVVPEEGVGGFLHLPGDTETEKRMRGLGLLDIKEIESDIRVCLKYATEDNFTGKVLYHDINKAFMLPETALCLVNAQRYLKEGNPNLNLMIYDAARPMSVQRELWMEVRGTDKCVYVSNPANGGGLHNYGAAVDVTLVDSAGNCLPMGCAFDYFGDEARPDREDEMVRQGRISLSDLYNRRLLRGVMTEAGFRVLPSEWWHFNLMSRDDAKEKLKMLE